jgi:uncharacterized protein Smg (DUF494 family)
MIHARIMDVVGLISRYLAESPDIVTNPNQIDDELSGLGFSSKEIKKAYRWIEDNTLGNPKEPQPEPLSQNLPPLRVFTKAETSKLKPRALGLLHRCYERGLLDPLLLDEVLEKVLQSEIEEFSEAELRRVVALHLFNRVQSDWKELLHSTNTLVH